LALGIKLGCDVWLDFNHSIFPICPMDVVHDVKVGEIPF